MTLTLALRDGARVVVAPTGSITYYSVTGRTYRRESLGNYAKSAEWVRGSAWYRDARFITEK